MSKISLLLLFALAALAQQHDPPGTLQSGSATIVSNGVGFHFHYTTVIEPPPDHTSAIRIHGGVTVDHSTIHRQMRDDVHHLYFGYDLRAIPGPAAGQYNVTISPLSLGSITETPVPLPNYPALTLVNDGDTIALDLLVSPDGKQKVVDYIQISGPPNAAPATTTAAEARDYAPDDGALRLRGEGMKVLVNGQAAGVTAGLTVKPGATIWLTAPNQGRYILSLTPQPGFHKAGAIRDNVIGFQVDGQEYEIRTIEPLLGSKGAWNLYVIHDQQYRSRGDGVYLGLDRLSNLLSRE